MSGLFLVHEFAKFSLWCWPKPSPKVIRFPFFQLGIVHRLHQNSAAISSLLIRLFSSPCFLPRRYTPVGSEPSQVSGAWEFPRVHLWKGCFRSIHCSTFSLMCPSLTLVLPTEWESGSFSAAFSHTMTLQSFSIIIVKPFSNHKLCHFLLLISNIQDSEVAHIRKTGRSWYHILTSQGLLNISWGCLPPLLGYLKPKPLYRANWLTGCKTTLKFAMAVLISVIKTHTTDKAWAMGGLFINVLILETAACPSWPHFLKVYRNSKQHM